MTASGGPADVAQRIAGLSAADRAALERALLARRGRAGEAGGIPRRPPGEPVPLSFAQRGMWFLDQWQPGSALYGVRVATRLSGDLDVSALRRAFAEVTRRHEVVRTTFSTVDGRPVQVIGAATDPPLPVFDVSALPAAARERAQQDLAAAAAARPYDLARGPLLRAGLIRTVRDEHVLLLSMHHIVADGWSYALLVKELSAAYAAYRSGREPAPAPLPLQYGDYAAWQQRAVHEDERLRADLRWWKETLAGAPPLLSLPADRPRPPSPTYRAGAADVRFGPELTSAVRALARQEGATLFMTLLAAFTTLLHRCTGATDLVVGSPVAGRDDTRLEELIGCFVNTLALRTDLSGRPSFRTVLARVREHTLAAYAHRGVPFEHLVEELRLGRNTSHSPVFQVMFAQGNTARPAWDLPGLRVRPLGLEQLAEPFDLSMTVTEDGECLDVEVTYARDLFDAGTVAELLTRFADLVAEVNREPGRSIDELPRYVRAQPAPAVAPASPPMPVADVPAEVVASVRDIWCDVLGDNAVTGETDFFTAGGHSLLAVQVITRVRQRTGAQLPVRALFEAPTLDAFVGRVHSAAPAEADPPLVPAGRDRPVPLSRAQRRIWYIDQFDRGGAHHNVAAQLDLGGPLRVAALCEAVAAMRRRHESLRTTFVRDGGEVEQVVLADPAVTTPIVDLTHLGPAAGPAADALAAREAALPFDLGRGPVWRVTVLRLGPDRHVLLSTIHHIVTDAWSSALLLEELWTMYAALIGESAPELPPLPVQYADYAIWERRATDGAALREAEAYWLRQLAGMPEELELAKDRPVPMTPVFTAVTLPYELSEEQTRDLVELSLREGVTLFMTVLAAYLIVLRRRTRTPDVVVGTGAANRGHVDVERVIGFFTNQLVLRAGVTGRETVRELLARVREVTLGAYTHERMPFDRLVELLRPARVPNRSPLFQVEIEYHRLTDVPPAPPGLTVSARELHSPTTTLDLSLHVVQTESVVRGGLVYNADVFTAATARRMAGEWRLLLAAMAERPDALVEDVAARAEEEWRTEAARQRKEAARARFRDSNARPMRVPLEHGGM